MIETVITNFMKITIFSFVGVVFYLSALTFDYHQSATITPAFAEEQQMPANFSLIG